MLRYYFHLVSPANPVRDRTRVELAGLTAAHWHATRLVYRLRAHASETGEDWVLKVADESGAVPLVVLPRSAPMFREPAFAGMTCDLPSSRYFLGVVLGRGDACRSWFLRPRGVLPQWRILCRAQTRRVTQRRAAPRSSIGNFFLVS